MNRKERIELLAPAGNADAFYAAINNGADAIYMGGQNFSARAFADNFSKESISELVRYAHLRNVRVYITLNTLLNEMQFANAIKDVEYYYQNKVDALIIQDLGLYYYIRNNYPDFEIHASTQMHIHNIEGVKTAEKMGFARCVVARESDADFIREACKENIEIETFVHGALCVSYSGQCLLSSATQSRSANKGMCAQCCRMRYQLKDLNSNHIKTDTDYLLSPKDMCLLEDIPSLIEAGVSSLKIEGRMKSATYVGYVTSLYRKAIDAYYSKKKAVFSETEKKNMAVIFNRGFTNTYYRKTDENLFGQKTPNHLGTELGKTLFINKEGTGIKLSDDLHQFDGIRLRSDWKEEGFIVNMMTVNGKLVNSARKGEVVVVKTKEKFPQGSSVYKTSDAVLTEEIAKIEPKQVPVNLKLEILPERKVKATVSEGDFVFEYTSDVCAQKAQKAPLSTETILKSFSKLKETPFYLQNTDIFTEDSFMAMSQLNSLRTEIFSAYEQYKYESFKRKCMNLDGITLGNGEDDQLDGDYIEEKGTVNEKYLSDPVININAEYPKENEVCSELGGILKGRTIGRYTLNIANSYGYEFMKRLGFKTVTLSSELNDFDINTLVEAYKERTGKEIIPAVYEGGNRVLMYFRRNPFVKYTDLKKFCLTDRDHTYLVNVYNDHTELVEEKDDTEFSLETKKVYRIKGY